MSFESEPLSSYPLGNAPVLPTPPQRWSPPLRFFLVLIVLLEVGATLFALSGKPLGASGTSAPFVYLLASGQAGLALSAVSIVVSLVAIWFARNILLRIAFLVGIVLYLCNDAMALPLLTAVRYPTALETWLYSVPFLPLFELALGVLGLLSQICLSYGLLRWQRSDKLFIWVQLLLTLGLGITLVLTEDLSRYAQLPAFFIENASASFLTIAGIACLVCRPACWRTYPLIVFCLTIGNIATLLFDYVINQWFSLSTNFIQYLQTTTILGNIGGTLFLLGVLLLIQEQRLQKQAQTGVPATP